MAMATYCPQHPHMTPERRQYWSEKLSDPEELAHHEGLHCAAAGCAQCVQAFLAQGGDPKKGSMHHKDWNLKAWAEYSFSKGGMSQDQLEEVKAVIAAHLPTPTKKEDALGHVVQGYCLQHPHMTPQQRERCENRLSDPNDLQHYEGLHCAAAGCAQCVGAFLAQGGDPHKGTLSHEKWNLQAWAQYSFSKGRISEQQLDSVKTVIAAYAGVPTVTDPCQSSATQAPSCWVAVK